MPDRVGVHPAQRDPGGVRGVDHVRPPGPGTRACTVSKNAPCTTSTPPARSPAASTAAIRWQRCAIRRSPSGPW